MSDLGRQFLSKMNYLDSLREYALTGVAPTQNAGWSAEVFARPLTPEGRVETQEWIRAFPSSLGLLGQFREAYLAGADVTDDDLRSVAETAERLADNLKTSLA